MLFTDGSAEDTIVHHPMRRDQLNIRKYNKLINAQPTEKNIIKYQKLALSLWETGRLDEAEKMFLKIVESEIISFGKSYYHSSDIPGDTSSNIYGYGSFTSNIKNEACIYLAKIYIEKKDFSKALKFLNDSEKKYIVSYNCGTGYHAHYDKIQNLFGMCYLGQEKYDSIISLFLPNFYGGNKLLITAIKKSYSKDQIKKYLDDAEKSIICIADSFQSLSITYKNYGTKEESKTEARYTLATGEMELFSKKVYLPRFSLEDGEVMSREMFIKEFKDSNFYYKLTVDEN